MDAEMIVGLHLASTLWKPNNLKVFARRPIGLNMIAYSWVSNCKRSQE
jgi:hypothetical protein